ncbi:NADPH-dependent FMN reductase [Nocardioides yefusunii]|uniref:NADPH-dependent FMN reductase n=1 Tax=Nocardioides yefusunii TaxID=2500546 RepID=A0ABW1QWA5_9ACTN|nr:NAD(P)H-dependent oxidoreductase [Nocardioides yefusunii]
MSTPRVAVVVGNPKPRSRTLEAAQLLADAIRADRRDDGPALVVDLADWGARLHDWSDTGVAALVAQVAAADLVVVASPTYNASYTGLLKVFLDRFAAGSITGVTVPLMLGAGEAHALAAQYTLAPLLAQISSTGPAKALFVRDARHDDPAAHADWLAANGADVRARIAARVAARATTTDTSHPTLENRTEIPA